MAEREILFRGKIINCDLVVSKEWIYGSYCDEAKSPIRLKGEKDYTLCPHISKYDPHYYLKGFGNLGAPYFYEVHPKTVGQYTNKTDIHGVKIFDGDICRFKRFNDVHVGKIIFDVKIASFVMWYQSIVGAYGEKAIHKMLISECDEIEVIGNIHDNPEILKNPNP